MTLEKAIELKAAVGRLMYSNNKDVRDYNALIDFMESALRPVSREQVEKLRGEWISLEPEIGLFECSMCDHMILKVKCNFCPNCGAPMTYEAVQMVMKRLEALKDG